MATTTNAAPRLQKYVLSTILVSTLFSAIPSLASAHVLHSGRVHRHLSRMGLAQERTNRLRRGHLLRLLATGQAIKAATGLAPSQVTAKNECLGSGYGCTLSQLVNSTTGKPVTLNAKSLSATVASQNVTAAPFEASWFQDIYGTTTLSQTGGVGQTIGLVEVGSTPTEASDMAHFRSFNNLPAYSGTLTVVNAAGGTSLPGTGPQVEEDQDEADLDIQAVSMMCPNCHIIVAETDPNDGDGGWDQVQQATQTLVSMGATQISQSMTVGGDVSGTPSFQSSGDDGYVGTGIFPSYTAPADSTMVGGTSIEETANESDIYNTVGWTINTSSEEWSAGSGCDQAQAQPSYQLGIDTGCAGRAYADVSADADPDTGLAVYEGWPDGGAGALQIIGGTSLAAPITASMNALMGFSTTDSPAWAYQPGAPILDVTGSGTNLYTSGPDPQTCSATPICTVGTGWDGVTGMGTVTASAAAAPSLTTASVANLGNTTATVADNVNAEDLFTTVTLTASDGVGSNVTQSQTFPANGDPQAETFSLTDLNVGDTYSYTLTATNIYGSATTSGSFTTSGGSDGGNPNPTVVAPSLYSPSNSNVTVNSATVGDSVNTGDGATVVVLTLTGNGSTNTYSQNVDASTSDQSVTFDLSNLASNTTYSYTISASNTAGSGNQRGGAFTTLTPPPVPTLDSPTTGDLSLTSAAASVNLNDSTIATVVTLTLSSSSGDATYTKNAPALDYDQGVTFNLTSLVPNTAYSYQIVATNVGGTSNVEDGSFTTTSQVPTLDGSASGQNVTDSSIQISMNLNDYNSAAVLTLVLSGGGGSDTYTINAPPAVGDQHEEFSLSGLAPSTYYTFALSVSNVAGSAADGGGSFATAAAPSTNPTTPTPPVTTTPTPPATTGTSANPSPVDSGSSSGSTPVSNGGSGGGGGSAAAEPTASAISTVSKANSITQTFGCSGFSGSCSFTLRLTTTVRVHGKKKTVVLTSKTMTVDHSQKGSIQVKLTASQLKLIAPNGHRASLTVVSGPRILLSKKVKLT